jgi:glucose/arabinose dehydrogenase/mono/diheme cytochrome c family protein
MPSFNSVLLPGAVLLGLMAGTSQTSAQPAATGNAERGRNLFQQSCALCHATGLETQPGAGSGQGPSLAGVMGRPAASAPNFNYSKALVDSKLRWDAASLDRYLTAPTVMVPGTTMVVPVASADDRRDLIAFLGTLRPALVAPASPPTTAAVPRAATPGDAKNDAPGVRHRIRVDALPAPYATNSARNQPRTIPQPAGSIPSVPTGFQVKLFASGLMGPRLLRTAPNGDIFIAETGRGRIRVLRAAAGADAPTENTLFAEGLQGPFGIAFYPLEGEPRWVYVANRNAVVRFAYRSGDLQASGAPEVIVPKLSETTGGHSTRDIAFSLDGKRMFISVGSSSNVAEGQPAKTPEEIREWEAANGRGSTWGPRDSEARRANVLVSDPEGKEPLKVFATGIRNPVGLAVQPGTGALWTSTNERDNLGDDLVPDYVTSVREGGFYGWPWYYMGKYEDPRHAGARPDLAGQAIVPDVPVQAHSAALQIAFYPPNVSGPSAFPPEYRGELFAAFHGSWNRAGRTGSKVVRVIMRNGVPTGEYEDFLTGFVVDDGSVWGRPVGVTVARDGALLVTDDANGNVWRVSRAPIY